MLRSSVVCPTRQLILALGFAASATGLTFAEEESAPPPKEDLVRQLGPDHAKKMARGLEIFKRDVRKILVDRCVRCHGGEKTRSKFDLTTRAGLLRGGAEGAGVVIGNHAESFVYQAIAHEEEPYMPHKEDKLPDGDIARIARWIDLGAPYDAPLVKRDDPAVTKPAMTIVDADRSWWAFRPLAPVEPPRVDDPSWCRTPVDRFVLEKLEEKGLHPNDRADPRKLIRRVYFDLIGLPPEPDQVEAFARDPTDAAYRTMVDELLRSPRHGERWGRHWLDVARFAESHGFEHDYDRKHAYHYRDFVIKAFNQDMPFDQFVRWQVAGDEFEPENPLALMATGFLGAGVFPTQITKNEVERTRYDALDDMAATTASAMLGLTVGCARCHDHKFDPIPTLDYYRLVSTFTTTVRTEMEIALDPEAYKKEKAAFDKAHAPFAKALDRFEAEQLPGRLERWLENRPRAKTATEQDPNGKKPTLKKPTGKKPTVKIPPNVAKILASIDKQKSAENQGSTPRKSLEKLAAKERSALSAWYRQHHDTEWKKLKAAVDRHLKEQPKLTKVMFCTEGLKPMRHHTQGADFFEKTHFLFRGDPDQKREVVNQGFLQVLTRGSGGEDRWKVAPPANWRTSYRRRSLANWLTDVQEGAGHLLARVIANRIWQHHIGRGIVATPNNFGTQGERPTHPELLDWLAVELVQSGWRLSHLHKLIMESSVYMQSARHDTERERVDPLNQLSWRRSVRRLEAETIRDALLAVSGLLDTRRYGPGTLDENQERRSIYFTVKRSKLVPMMQLFDAPEALVSLGTRPTTTIAPQALMFMNNPNVRKYARGFARRLTAASRRSIEDAVTKAYLIAVARGPTPGELEDSVRFVREQSASYREKEPSECLELALTTFCQVLMSLNEFIYVE